MDATVDLKSGLELMDQRRTALAITLIFVDTVDRNFHLVFLLRFNAKAFFELSRSRNKQKRCSGLSNILRIGISAIL